MKTLPTILGAIGRPCRAIALVLAAAMCTAPAATFTVTTTADSGAGSLRAALASAHSGDTIDASGVSGTILLTSGELLVTTNLTIFGPGPASLAVNGNAASRVFHIYSDSNVTIAGLTITNGYDASIGGGIYNDGAALTVSNCSVSGNSAGGTNGSSASGGGIFYDSSASGLDSLTILDCAINGNSATVEGGGIDCYGTRIFIGNSTISSNVLTMFGPGGGINNFGAELTISNSTLSGNSTTNGGGGAIYNTSGEVTLAGSTLSGNSAISGGGIYNDGTGLNDEGAALLTIVNSTLSGNSAILAGGICNDGSYADFFNFANLFIFDSTLSSNSSWAIYSVGSIGNNVYHNSGVNIGGSILSGGASITNYLGTVYSYGYNLSSDNGGGYLNQPTDLINTNALLGPLQNNGGPTFTQALLPGSPAIDQGTNFSGWSTDQRGAGFARTVDDVLLPHPAGGDGTDIGAFEVQRNLPPVALCQNLTVLAGPGGTANASINDGSYDPYGDTLTFNQSPPGPYPIGTNEVTLTATDSQGVSNSCVSLVVVRPETVYVSNTGDSGSGSLRDSVADAAPGERIDLTGVSGTIRLTSGELLIDENMVILGPGPTNLVVDGNGASRVFHITNAVTVSISGLTISNGIAPTYNGLGFTGLGGGILNENAALALSNCTVVANRIGGGIYAGSPHDVEPEFSTAALTVLSSSILGNQGGGIEVYSGGNLTVSNSVINFNYDGWGVSFSGGALTMSSNTISGNYAGISAGADMNSTIANSTITYNNDGAEYGGGIWNLSRMLSVTNCTISYNYASGGGGGIANFDGNLALDSSTLIGNMSEFGGGIVNGDNGTVAVSRCLLSGNSAAAGGGICNGGSGFGGGPMTVSDSTLSGNTTSGAGGGIWNFIFESTPPVYLYVFNCTMSNSSSFGSDNIANVQGLAEIGSTILQAGASGTNIGGYLPGLTSLGYNLSSDNGSGVLTNTGDQIDTNPLLGRLQNNGGPTLTYALLLGNPAIEKGRNFSGSATDQRGLTRTYVNPGVARPAGGDGTDIGAFEFFPPMLAIFPNYGDVVLSWSTNNPEYTVESTADLTNYGSWVPVPGTPLVIGNQYLLGDGPATGSKFYRLRAQ